MVHTRMAGDNSVWRRTTILYLLCSPWRGGIKCSRLGFKVQKRPNYLKCFQICCCPQYFGSIRARLVCRTDKVLVLGGQTSQQVLGEALRPELKQSQWESKREAKCEMFRKAEWVHPELLQERSWVWSLEHGGFWACLHFGSPGRLYRYSCLCPDPRGCDLIGLRCGLGVGIFKSSPDDSWYVHKFGDSD